MAAAGEEDGWRLLESCYVDPATGSVTLLERHAARMATSAAALGFAAPPPADALAELAKAYCRSLQQQDCDGKVVMLRVLLSRDGSVELGHRLIDWHPPVTTVPRDPASAGDRALAAGLPVRKVAAHQIAATPCDFLAHKTTQRECYAAAGAAAAAAGATDSVLHTPDGCVTECCIANVALWRGGGWVTPALRRGIMLPGTLRAELLERGELSEGVISIAELRSAPAQGCPWPTPLLCFNSVRGLWFAELVAPAPPAG
eukprot:TRINITY_DN28223_c0_g1_i1.p1 TRINITY_DN28223_c0_g1~~TRINITY_DN28223_c0_g1_i1.p1  ORF type:complete len:291 (+),score=84.52 TRINITY_DN28223_c0_g1_i1:100-873(+)